MDKNERLRKKQQVLEKTTALLIYTQFEGHIEEHTKLNISCFSRLSTTRTITWLYPKNKKRLFFWYWDTRNWY